MKYKKYVAVPNFVRDEMITRSRNHAFNRGLSALLISTVIIIVANYISWRLFEKSLLAESLILLVSVTLWQYGSALKEYTEQDRDIILSRYFPPELQVAQIERESDAEVPLTERTEFPHPENKNGRLILAVSLTREQKEKIARAGLEKNSLPINLIESFGLSRQMAERLRTEMASHDLGYFTDRDRFILTKNGQKVFAKILRNV
jgi:hypothetical protein